jgi:hypothetical protein
MHGMGVMSGIAFAGSFGQPASSSFMHGMGIMSCIGFIGAFGGFADGTARSMEPVSLVVQETASASAHAPSQSV